MAISSSKNIRPLNLTVEISSSDSDDSTSLRLLTRLRKRATFEQQTEPSSVLREISVVRNKCNDMESQLVRRVHGTTNTNSTKKAEERAPRNVSLHYLQN